MNILTFKPEHIGQMVLQPHQRALWISYGTTAYLERLAAAGPAISGEVDGRIVACGGITQGLFGCGMAWAVMDESAGRHFVRLHKVMRRMLDLVNLRRIEASVETSFAQGCRWLDLFGFEREGIMRAYGPDGSDHYLYSRIS